MLKLDNLSTNDPTLPLDGLHASFEPGKIYTVLGRTGAGKTELLRTLIGLDPISNGAIYLDEQNLARSPVRARQMSMVYQQFINYPHLNVRDNVAFPLWRQKVPKKEARDRALDILKLVGLSGFENRMPSELSGGQQQRVALARAIVKRARILLMDEPLANLDYKLREQLREEFPLLLHDNVDGVIIYTTSEPGEAMQLGDELIVMQEGRIVAQGDPNKLFDHPPNIDVARVISDPPISMCAGEILADKIVFEDGTRFSIPNLRSQIDGTVQVGIRPDSITIGGQTRAKIELAEFSGSNTIVHLNLPFTNAVMMIDGIHEFHHGEELMVTVDARSLLFFSIDGQLLNTKET